MRFKKLSLALFAAGLLAQPAMAQRATTLGLGTPSHTSGQVTGINDAGQVIGSLDFSPGITHAVLFSGGGIWDIGTLGGNNSDAYGINASGQIAGTSNIPTSSGDLHAFLYSGGTMRDLGTLGGSYSVAYGLNDAGQVAGYSNTGSNNHAFLYSGGVMQDLGTFSSYGNSRAYAINNAGQVVGYSSTLASGSHAFLYSGGVMQDLGTLGGSDSRAYGINNAGMVVGQAFTAATETHAFLYSGGVMHDLGTLGGNYSSALGINSSGQVVGGSYTTGTVMHAFLYSGGVMHDLNALAPTGWTFTGGVAINSFAQIAGYGVHGSFQEFFRLTLHPDWQGGNGYWSDASRWNFAGMGSFGILPGLPHDVAIAPSASATVYGPSDATVNSLAISAGAGQLAKLDLNNGSITATNGTTLGNNATVTGNGRLAGNLTIGSGGRVLVGSGQSMELAGNVANGGRIDAQAYAGRANLEIGGTLNNAAGSEVNLMNADVYVHGGTMNAGRISLAGATSLSGSAGNQIGGQVNVSGVAGEAIFWDNFVNNGTVNVTSGSTATFFGLVSGTGSFLGGGTKHFAGGVSPGASPGLMTLGGSIVFSGGTLTMELGGLVPGSGHDKLVFLPGSTVALAGIGLNVEYWGGWTAAAGQTYDLFDWHGLSGTFSSVALPALASGLAWNTSALYTSGEISVAAVPEPGTWMMLLAGLGLLGVAARRRV